MSDNIVDLVSDYEVKTSYTYAMGASPYSPHPYLSSDHVGPKIITQSDESGSDWAYENSLEEETSSSMQVDTLI